MVVDDPTFNGEVGRTDKAVCLNACWQMNGQDIQSADGWQIQMSQIVPPHTTWSTEGCYRYLRNLQEEMISTRK